MTYLEWFESHAQRHQKVVKKLQQQGMTQAQIIEYFDFENMCDKEPDFCPLYAERKKCHEMPTLNCYLCACPYFRFSDAGFRTEAGVTTYSYCSIDAKEGASAQYGDAIHHDCSKCHIPHRRAYVTKHFDTQWKRIMKACHD